MPIRANIDYYRSLRHVSQQEIQTRLGISRPTYQRKCGNNGFTIAELLIVADVLHTTLGELVKGV